MPTTTTAITPRQEAFLRELIAEVFPGQDASAVLSAADAKGAFRTRATTSAAITSLIARRDAARATTRAARPATAAAVPDGHYALPGDTDGGWDFYKVVSPTEGRWAGRTFVNRFRSDYLDRLTVADQKGILARIAEDVDGAGRAFADHSEACRRCGRRLTDLPTAATNGGWGPECVKLVAG